MVFVIRNLKNMNRKIEIILISALVLIGIGAFFLLNQGPQENASQAGTTDWALAQPATKEITIRNVTKEVVTYTLSLDVSNAKPVEKKLPVGAIDRIPTIQPLIITYKKYGRDIEYSLTPGKPYSFRYDSNDQVDIWEGSHGRVDAEDLAPFVPTPTEVVAKMLEMAQADKDDIVYDIGCGDGRIVIAAAQKYGARGVGIDIDPQRIKESMANAKSDGVEKLVKFRLEDATKTDISSATIVTIYLLPESNELLRPKLERELRPGTFVVSHNYTIPGWEGKEVDSATVTDSEGTEHYIYVYKR
jgi:SAM-dependent methyltransferase